jgi:hypothetical protein
LSKTKSLIGNLDILVYLQPTNDLYLKVPAKPAAVFSYEVAMNRLSIDSDDAADVKKYQYPFLNGDAGPIELSNYFGY